MPFLGYLPLTTINILKSETEIDRLDVETALTYFKQFIGSLSKHWKNMNVKQQQRLQKLVLPEGITYNKTAGAYGTAVLSPIFRLDGQFTDDQSDVVAGPGIEPGSGGYEPPEVPLLYPAVYLIFVCSN